MNSKLIIDIPEGTTKLDLRPILVPIIRGLLTEHHSHDRHVTRKTVESWIEDAFEMGHRDDRIVRLNQAWVVAYAESHNWELQHRYWGDKEIRYKKQKPTPDKERNLWLTQPHDRRHFHFNVPDADVSPSSKLSMLCRSLLDAQHADRLSLDEILNEIESYGPPLLQLAKAAQ